MIKARKIYDEMNKDMKKFEQKIIRGNVIPNNPNKNNEINKSKNVQLPNKEEVIENNHKKVELPNYNEIEDNNNKNININNSNNNDLPSYEEIQKNQENIIINNNDEEINDLPSYEEIHKNKIIKYVNEDGIEVIEYNENINMKFDQKECLICIGEFENGEKLSVLGCKHCYHEICLKDWIKKAKGIFCPLCQASRE